MAWNMTQNFYKNSFQKMALTNDLGVYDVEVTARQQGQGVQLSATVVTSIQMRTYWSAEIKAEVDKQLTKYFAAGDTNFVKPMTPNDWLNVLVTMGYDFTNKSFPGTVQGGTVRPGTVGMNNSLAALNSPGYVPPVPAIAPTIAPPQPVQGYTVEPVVVPQPVTAAPPVPPVPPPPPPQPRPVQPAQPQPVLQQPVAAPPPIPQSVVPPIPQRAAPPPIPQAAQPAPPTAFQSPAPVNVVPNLPEAGAVNTMSPEELSSILNEDI
jgi:hypothetical protein